MLLYDINTSFQPVRLTNLDFDPDALEEVQHIFSDLQVDVEIGIVVKLEVAVYEELLIPLRTTIENYSGCGSMLCKSENMYGHHSMSLPFYRQFILCYITNLKL